MPPSLLLLSRLLDPAAWCTKAGQGTTCVPVPVVYLSVVCCVAVKYGRNWHRFIGVVAFVTAASDYVPSRENP